MLKSMLTFFIKLPEFLQELEEGVVQNFIGIVVTHFKFICMKDNLFIIRSMYSAYLCMEFLCITTYGNFAAKEPNFSSCVALFYAFDLQSKQNNIFMSVKSDEKNGLQIF